MSEGSVDIGGISSFAYAENQETFQLLPQLSVSSARNVGSIFLFSKVPLSQLEGKTVALTSSSATSVHLLKIILGKFCELGVDYVTMEPDFERMMEYDACLLIGDDAIQTYWSNPEGIYRYDLGELWNERTGYPMTYAVVAARTGAIQRHSWLMKDLYDEMISSKKRAQRNHFRDMITSIQYEMGGDRHFWEHYFAGLNHDFTEKQREGLLYYYQLAYDMGFIVHPVRQLSLWQEAENWQSV